MVLSPHNNVVYGDVDELDEEPNEAHEAKPDGCGDGDLLEFFPVRLRIKGTYPLDLANHQGPKINVFLHISIRKKAQMGGNIISPP